MDKPKRTCLRCGTEMLENCYITIQGHADSPVIKQDTGKLFSTNLGGPEFALCPHCGEISWYMNPVYLEDLQR